MLVYSLRQFLREMGTIINDILKSGSQMDLRGANLGEQMKCLIRQCGGAVLYCTAHAILLTSHLGKPFQSIKIELYAGDSPVRQDHSPMRGAGLHADFRDSFDIRLQPGAPRHYGGSNRTIIKQAYEMLVSDRTALAAKPVGCLVTLDKVFELVEGNH